MRMAAKRPYIFAKIHGIFSNFMSSDELLQYLRARTARKSLEKLELSSQLPDSEYMSQEEREYLLHSAFITRMLHLLPAQTNVCAFFRALFSEYELRNLSCYLKKARGGSLYYAFPRELGQFNADSLERRRESVDQELAASSYAAIVTRFQEHQDPVELDILLERHYLEQLYNTARHLPLRDRRVILPLFRQYLDMKNTVAALRFNRIYRLEVDTVLQHLFLPEQEQRRAFRLLLTQDDFPTLTDLFLPGYRSALQSLLQQRPTLAPTEYDSDPGLAEIATVEKLSGIYLHGLYRKGFYRNQMTFGPLFCFYFLLKREILNIMLLYNSIRFNVDQETFRSELVT